MRLPTHGRTTGATGLTVSDAMQHLRADRRTTWLCRAPAVLQRDPAASLKALHACRLGYLGKLLSLIHISEPTRLC